MRAVAGEIIQRAAAATSAAAQGARHEESPLLGLASGMMSSLQAEAAALSAATAAALRCSYAAVVCTVAAAVKVEAGTFKPIAMECCLQLLLDVAQWCAADAPG